MKRVLTAWQHLLAVALARITFAQEDLFGWKGNVYRASGPGHSGLLQIAASHCKVSRGFLLSVWPRPITTMQIGWRCGSRYQAQSRHAANTQAKIT